MDGREENTRLLASQLMRWIMEDGSGKTSVGGRDVVGLSQSRGWIVPSIQHAAEMDPARNAGSRGSMSLMSSALVAAGFGGDSAGPDARRGTRKGGYVAMRLGLIASALVRSTQHEYSPRAAER